MRAVLICPQPVLMIYTSSSHRLNDADTGLADSTLGHFRFPMGRPRLQDKTNECSRATTEHWELPSCNYLGELRVARTWSECVGHLVIKNKICIHTGKDLYSTTVEHFEE
jgi:hypothetical protein